MVEDATSELMRLYKDRSEWVKVTRKNKFEDGIRRLLSDLYPDQAHFIFELLQNAEDAGASIVKFQLSRNELILRHDGPKLFDREDVESITSIGESTKKEEVNQIGKFGVGFKAVFAYSDTPQIHSGEYNFEIQDLVCPKEIPEISKLDQETVFVLPFNNLEKTPESCFSEIKTVFETLDHTVMLFLNNIESIEWNLNGKASGSAVREHLTDIDERLIKVSVIDSSNEEPLENAWFLRFQKELEDYGNLPCSIALELSFRKDNQSYLDVENSLSEQMKVVPARGGKLCVFFPAVKETTGLKIHVNGPYATTIDRASIPHDNEDNKAIFKSTANLFIESMEILKKTDMLTPEFLGVLPNDWDDLKQFYANLRDHVYDALNQRALIPCLDGGHDKAGKLVRGRKELTDVLGKEALAMLFDDGDKQWATGVLRNSSSDRLLDSLDIPYFGYEKLISAIYEKFAFKNIYGNWRLPDDDALRWLREQSDNWLQSFYLLLFTAVKRENKENRIWLWQIIKADDGEFHFGFKVYFLEGEKHLATELPTVPNEIFDGLDNEKQTRLHDFFLAAGVKPIGEREVLKNILEQFYTKGCQSPGNKKHRKHIKRFIRWSKENGVELFNDYYIFRDSKEEHFCQGKQCYIDRPLKETELNSLYFDGTGRDKSRLALWSGYSKVDDFIQFAEACGVQIALKIEKGEVWSNPKYKELVSGIGRTRVTQTGINEDYYIESLTELLEENSVGIARLVWQTLARAEPRVLKARYRPNQQHDTQEVPSSLVQTLQKSKWIPGKDGEFYSPKKMTRESLRSDFEYDNRNEWLKAVGFEEEEQKATEEYRRREKLARKLGITIQDVTYLKDIKKSSKRYEELIRLAEKSSKPSLFPERPSKNPKNRFDQAKKRASEAPEKKYEVRDRSTRSSDPTGDKVTYLLENYGDDENQIICQICQNEMPFRLLNDERDYFEAVQLFDDLKREHEAAYVALCPLCAAKFKELVKGDKQQHSQLKEDIASLDSKSFQIGLKLGIESGSIRFVERHLIDIKGLLAAEDEMTDTKGSSN